MTMKRKIIEIDEAKCNGCGLCANACHEGAIEIIDGKAKLVSDTYCDGLGDCLPACPTGAITIVEKEAADYDAAAVEERKRNRKMAQEHPAVPHGHGCPGAAMREITRKTPAAAPAPRVTQQPATANVSELKQWPIQLKLMHTQAPYLENADLLIAADCTAYAYANFHPDFMKDRITIIGCPKLDDTALYQAKLTEMLTRNNINSITVVRMSVPCCGGIVNTVKQAMLNAGVIVPYREIIITPEGEIVKDV